MESFSVQIDRVLHEPTRLRIAGFLAQCGGSATFVATRKALGIKHINSLAVHARVLQDAGYVEASRQFVDRRPQTRFLLTATGRNALARYRDMINRATEAAE
jgi:DNA-binding transcriptional ArsR family regulator